MPQTDIANRPATSRGLRRYAMWLIAIVCLTAICCIAVYAYLNPTAPSVAVDGAIAVTWNHLRAERWGYTLDHDTRVAYFGFWPHGGVGATTGTRTGELETVTAIGYKWKLESPTRLVLTDQDGIDTYYTFELNGLTENTAVLTDVSTGETLSFNRRYHGQDGG